MFSKIFVAPASSHASTQKLRHLTVPITIFHIKINPAQYPKRTDPGTIPKSDIALLNDRFIEAWHCVFDVSQLY